MQQKQNDSVSKTLIHVPLSGCQLSNDVCRIRADLQHNLWLLTLKGELGLSPKISGPAKRVLDCGTGTGIWAIEYGEWTVRRLKFHVQI
jgi:hypothetical protein